ELRGHLGVQAYRYLVLAERLDVPGQLDTPAVQLWPASRLHRLDDLARRDRAKQAATGAGPRRQGDLELGELVADLVRLAEVPNLPGRAGPLDRGDLLLGAAAPRDGEPLRKQVVAPVPVLDLDDVTGRTQAGHLGGEDDLHSSPLSDRSWCTRA